MPPTLAEVVAVLERRYDPRWAEDWDAVGLVLGDPQAPVRRIQLAIDPAPAVAAEAIAAGADLLITHHPLYLRPVSSVAATSPRGRVVHELIRAGTALYVAHTNADVARPGVSDALAGVLGLTDLAPLRPAAAEPLDKLVTFVPHAQAEALVDALAAAGAGAIGDYRRCAWTTTGLGTFRPEAGANPAIGQVGVVERVPETRVEMVLPRTARAAVVAALRAAHPYEEPAYDVLELAELPARGGLGRVGTLPAPRSLRSLSALVAERLPATAGGVRAAGDPDRPIRRVAVCGGSGGCLAAAATAAGADVLVTADLRHHVVADALAGGCPALIDAGHWATEWPWLGAAAAALRVDLADTVEPTVSTLVTDPWTLACRPESVLP